MENELLPRKVEYKILLTVFKYLPVTGVLIMLSYDSYLLHGNRLLVYGDCTGCFFMGMLLFMFFFFMILQMLLSHFLGFCLLHRLMIAYVMAMGGCILWEYFVGFGEILVPARWFMWSLGVMLLAAMMKRGCWK